MSEINNSYSLRIEGGLRSNRSSSRSVDDSSALRKESSSLGTAAKTALIGVAVLIDTVVATPFTLVKLAFNSCRKLCSSRLSWIKTGNEGDGTNTIAQQMLNFGARWGLVGSLVHKLAFQTGALSERRGHGSLAAFCTQNDDKAFTVMSFPELFSD